MYKKSGYNPQHNDWFWVKALADGTVEKEGMVEGCQNCHGDVKENDYIWTGSAAVVFDSRNVSAHKVSRSRRERSSASNVAASMPRSVLGRCDRRFRQSHLASSRSTAMITAALMVQLFSRA